MGVDTRPRHRLEIDPEVTRRYPGYRALVIYAYGLSNGPSDGFSRARLRAAEEAQRGAFGSGKVSDHPHMAAWREAYRSFGLKPSRYPNSAEALLSRVLRGDGLPAINRLVDLYNAVSVKFVLPVGGEDLDHVANNPTLRTARGDEPFDTMRDGEPVIEAPQQGEVVWLDQKGVTCRGWNWRQGVRTRLTESTANAYFVLDRLEPYGHAELVAAGDELIQLIRAASPCCSLETALLGSSPESAS